MTGMGGGSLMTPILILVFGFDARVAVGTDILHGAIFKSFGAVRHRMLGTVHARLALWMLLGSAPLSLVGVADREQLERERRLERHSELVGVALIIGGLGFLVKTFVHGPAERRAVRPRRGETRSSPSRSARAGGFVVGLTSVGSGTFFGLAMLFRVSADGVQDGRHRHLPRGRTALGRGPRPPRARQRRHARDGAGCSSARSRAC